MAMFRGDGDPLVEAPNKNEQNIRWIKEAMHIRKEGQQAMNRNEGSYQLSYAYDRFLDTASSRCVKNRKNWVGYQLLLTKASDRGRNVKFLGNNFGCVWVI